MKIHHIGHLVSDMQKAIERFVILGYCIQDAVVTDNERNIEICFMKNDATLVELVKPLPGGSSVGKLADKTPNAPYHICYETEDITSTIGQLSQKSGGGYIIVQPPKNAVAISNRKVAFLYNKYIGLIELVEVEQGIL